VGEGRCDLSCRLECAGAADDRLITRSARTPRQQEHGGRESPPWMGPGWRCGRPRLPGCRRRPHAVEQVSSFSPWPRSCRRLGPLRLRDRLHSEGGADWRAVLTADEAWTKWEHGHHLTPDVTPEFGRLKDQGRYRLAWGFSHRGCIMPNGFPSHRQIALAKSPKCREWTFLNPTTGRQILTADLYPPKS